jgi:hypothetical protein
MKGIANSTARQNYGKSKTFRSGELDLNLKIQGLVFCGKLYQTAWYL